jgi:hypothetical protein
VRALIRLYLLHPDAEKHNKEQRKVMTDGTEPNRCGAYERLDANNLIMSDCDLSYLQYWPFFENIRNEWILYAREGIVTAYLNLDTRVHFSPNLGYIANVFISYIPSPITFAAYAHLLATKNYRVAMFFDSDRMCDMAKVWKKIIRK